MKMFLMKGITRVLSRSSVIWCEPARVFCVDFDPSKTPLKKAFVQGWKPIPIWAKEKHIVLVVIVITVDMEHYHQKHTYFFVDYFCFRKPWDNGVFVSWFGQVWYVKNLGSILNIVLFRRRWRFLKPVVVHKRTVGGHSASSGRKNAGRFDGILLLEDL